MASPATSRSSSRSSSEPTCRRLQNCRQSHPQDPDCLAVARKRKNEQARPSTAQLLVIAGFALFCFRILLFPWITFGGPTPFRAKPYEIEIPFNEATQLAQQSDVRISGVSVGKEIGRAHV